MCQMHANFDVQLWNWFLVMNSYSTLQVCMKFAYIVTGLVFLLSYWISDNVTVVVFCSWVSFFFSDKLLFFWDACNAEALNLWLTVPNLKPHFPCLSSFSISFLELARVSNTNFLRTFSWLRSIGFYPLYNIHAFNDLSENNMFSIQPRCFGGTNKKLGPIGVASWIGHRQDSRSSVPQLKILILKIPIPVDGFAPSSVMLGEITALAHEVGDHTVEGWASESEPLFTSTKGAEVFSGPGDYISSQL